MVGLKLIQLYLKNRNAPACVQSTINGKINCMYSEKSTVNTGIPQGSILGSILFLVYVNDVSSYIDVCSLNEFADDISVIISAKSIKRLLKMS